MLCMLELGLVQSVLHIRTTLLLSNGTKDQIHFLQGPALGFLNEEGDKDSISSAEDAEHDEGLPANAMDGARGDLGNNEVEQPLSGSSETDTVRAKASRENLKTNSALAKPVHGKVAKGRI